VADRRPPLPPGRTRVSPGVSPGVPPGVSQRLLPGVAPAAFLLLWWITSAVVGSFLLPPPQAVLQRILEIAGTALLPHLLASLGRVTVALTTATLTALPLGIALGRIGWVSRLFTPLVYILYPVPKIALLPLVFLLAGVGEGARVFLLWLVLFFQVLVAVRDSVVAIPDGYRRSLTLLGGRRRDQLRYVILPAILPALLTALRIGSATALAVLFFAETFFTNRGLGFFIVDSWMKASYTDMTAGIVAISLVGVLIFSLLDLLQRKLCAWKRFEL
jgi:NitT/TauT family transport system permease protein